MAADVVAVAPAGRSGAPAPVVVAVVVGVTLVGAARRAAGFPAGSLWHDDAWTAAVHLHDWPSLLDTSQTFVGFRALLKVISVPFGTEPAAFQAIPVLLAIAAVPLAYLVGRRIGMAAPAALVAAGLVALSPVLSTYGNRVKPFSFDAVAALVGLWLAIRLIEEPRARRRWLEWTLFAAASIVVSGQLLVLFGSITAVLVIVAGRRTEWRVWAPPVAALGAAVSAWSLLVLAPVSGGPIREVWTRQYIDRSSPVAVVTSTYERAEAVIAGLAGPSRLVVVLVPLVLVAIWRRGPIAWVAIAPLAGAWLAAAAERVPLGAGRTDSYLLPLLAVLVALGVDELWRMADGRAPAWRWVIALAAVGILLALRVPDPAPYPDQDAAPLVDLLERRQRTGDVVVLYPMANFAYGLYADGEIGVEYDPEWPNGWTIRTADRPVVVLPRWARDRPEEYPALVSDSLTGARRVWLLGAHLWRGDFPALQDAIGAQGFREVRRWDASDDAVLVLMER